MFQSIFLPAKDNSLSFPLENFQLLAILGYHLDTDHLDAPLIGEGSTVIASRHRPLQVIIHDLTEEASLWKPCQGT